MQKFKKGDLVIVTAGKDKGKKGEIIKVLPKQDKVIVRGVNMYKKHLKPTPNESGKIIERERPLPTANIAILDKDGNPTRVGFVVGKDGRKYRISKKTNQPLD